MNRVRFSQLKVGQLFSVKTRNPQMFVLIKIEECFDGENAVDPQNGDVYGIRADQMCTVLRGSMVFVPEKAD